MSKTVVRKNESLDDALRRFKRSVSKTGTLQEYRKREFYEKPSVKRKKKSEAARKRKNKRRFQFLEEAEVMSLLESLQKDMVAAMKAKDKAKLSTVRMLKAAVTNEQINVGHDLTSDEEVSVLSRELKQRKDSLEEFKAAGRDQAVADLEAEIAVVESYLPEQLSVDEVKAVVEETIKAVGATSKADFGKVMGVLMPKLKGKADGKLVNATVKELLQ